MTNFQEARRTIEELNERFTNPIPLTNINISLCVLGNDFLKILREHNQWVILNVDYDRKTIEISSRNNNNVFIPQIETNKKYTSAEFVLSDYREFKDKIILNFIIMLERAITKQEISLLKSEKLLTDDLKFTEKAVQYFSHSRFLFFIENGGGDMNGRLMTKITINEVDDIIVDCLNYEAELKK